STTSGATTCSSRSARWMCTSGGCGMRSRPRDTRTSSRRCAGRATASFRGVEGAMVSVAISALAGLLLGWLFEPVLGWAVFGLAMLLAHLDNLRQLRRLGH